jgi:hypothetical protein
MPYKYYNPNPRHNNSVGDCTIRAVSKALNIPWETAYIDLVMQGYEIGDMPSSNAVLNSYLRSKRFRRNVVSNLCPDCYTFGDFAKEHPKGTYIVCTGTHVACIKDEILYDSWNSSDEAVIFYYEREDY